MHTSSVRRRSDREPAHEVPGRGAGGYFINLGVFAWLLRLGVPYLVDSIVSYFVSNAVMYLGNRYYTFGLGHAGFWRAYVRYILVGLVVAALNAIVLAFLVEVVGLYAVYAQALSLLVITPVAFVLNKRWTFRPSVTSKRLRRHFGMTVQNVSFVWRGATKWSSHCADAVGSLPLTSRPGLAMKTRILPGLALLATVSCVSTNATVLDPSIKLARTCPDAVRLFTTPAKVASPYREVALLHSKGESGWSNEEQMMESMREKAAEHGANGVILDNIDEPSALTKVIGTIAKTGTQRKGKALAIYIPADSTSGAALCATREKKA